MGTWRRRLLGKRSLLWLVLPARCFNCGHREGLARWHRAHRCKDVMRCAQRIRAAKAVPLPPAPAPEPVSEPEPVRPACAYCGGPLPENAQLAQQYCTPAHSKAAQRRRAQKRLATERAWTLDSNVEAHAVSCASKFAYETAGEALTALRWLRSDKGDGRTGRVYKCLACLKWHITTSDGKRSNGARREALPIQPSPAGQQPELQV